MAKIRKGLFLLACALFAAWFARWGKVPADVDWDRSPESALIGGLPALWAAAFRPPCYPTPAPGPCSAGEQRVTLSGCSSSGLPMHGNITYRYDTVTCSPGGSLSRTAELLLVGIAGGSVRSTTDARTDYRGHPLGGGSKLTPVDGTRFELRIGGIHRVSTTGLGNPRYDLSLRTLGPVTLTRTPQGAQLFGGEVEIIHDLAGYVATFRPQFTFGEAGTCCHPTGNVEIAYEGAQRGKARAELTGCGKLNFQFEHGPVRQLKLEGCA